MHSESDQVRARAERLLRQRIAPAEYREREPLTIEGWVVPGEPVPVEEALRQEYRPIRSGSAWGRPWGTTWLRLTGRVPASWADDGRHRLEMLADLGFTHLRPGFQAEGLVHDGSGHVIKAIEPLNRAVRLPQLPGEDVTLFIEAASNPDLTNPLPDGSWPFDPSPLGSQATAPADPLYRLGEIALARHDTVVWELMRDVTVVFGLLDHLPDDRPRHAQLVRALKRMIEVLDPLDVPETAPAAREALTPVLENPAVASAHRVFATGHAHIDSAWMWPTRETVRKCARTFSNVLDLMNTHDELVFACSSAQQLEWVRESYPELFERIMARVREGRFVPVGGMWVESDTNMPSGESLVRQFVEGGEVFREVLGVEAQEVWLPDSFGYSAGLPQIAVAAGARWLLTQKMSWNDTNAMPHHTFWWEGIDGTRIFTHFPPADTYVSDLSVADLDRAERQFADKGPATMSLLPFGHGDGGGGPTREMLGDVRRLRDVEGAPRVEIAAPQRFFSLAEDEYGAEAPVWSGEMYLELHRGVYTSQANTKRGNRRCEQLLHDAELWATTAAVRRGTEYPADRLRALWRTVLLQQFHDILPGSSIAWVHEEAERNYVEVEREAGEIIDASLAALVGDGGTSLWVNSAPVPRGPVVPMSVSAEPFECSPVAPAVAPDGAFVLDNGVVRAMIDAEGTIGSLVDLATGRELFPGAARGAQPQSFPDMPTQWDAWDVDLLDRGRGTDLRTAGSVVAIERAGRPWVEARWSFGASTLVQRYGLDRGASSLRIEVEVDWQERERMLKLAFPVDVQTDRYASQTQFGHVQRPLHANTSWDAARFETCAHRFVHVTEGDFGVGVANSATYGHDVTRRVVDGRILAVIRPTLLRAPEYPAPDADRGFHAFSFRLVVGGVRAAVTEGFALASPPREVRGDTAVEPLLRVDDDRVVVDTVKSAQDGSGDVVIRVYEPEGERAEARILLGFAAEQAWVTDLHERPQRALVVSDGTITMPLHAFGLATIRVRPGSGRER